MNTKKKPRSYSMINRAKSAAKNDHEILKATGELWKTLPIGEITLEKVAEKSGVTVRTILRKFGSKEGLLEAGLNHDAANITQDRSKAVPGDLESIITTLLSNYEEMGDAGIRVIYMEQELDITKKIGEEGRKVHREWCAKVFAPFLPKRGSQDYELKLNAFIAATEIYLWKLLRKDLGMSKDQTKAVFKMMVEGLILKFQNQ